MANELIIITTDFLGKFLLAVMALMVHNKVTREKRIDIKVIREMRAEQILGVVALFLFLLSYILNFI